VQNRNVANTLFLSIYHKVSQYTCSRYTCHCNLIHTIRKVRTDFPPVILAEHTCAQQHYVQVSCRDFHQNPTINGSSLTPVSQIFMAFAVLITKKSIRFLWLSPVPSFLIRIKLYKIAASFYYNINYSMAVTVLY
jgi:hypothetical protein